MPSSLRPSCAATTGSPVGCRDGRAGAVLVIVMLAMIGLLGIPLTGVFLTGGNVQIAANQPTYTTRPLYVAGGRSRTRVRHSEWPGSGRFSGHARRTGHVAIQPTRYQNSLDGKGQPVGRGAIMRDAAGVALYQVSYPTSVSRTEPISRRTIPMARPNTFNGQLHRLCFATTPPTAGWASTSATALT